MNVRAHNLLTAAALSLLWVLQTAVLTAQTNEEASFRAEQAAKLNKYAKKAFDQGFPREAKIVWLMVLREYDPDDKVARKALGYIPIGKTWAPDEKFHYPSQDKPNATAAKRLRSAWQSVARDVGGAHRRLALKYEKAGRTDKSRYHFEQVIRYVPEDKVAKKALSFKAFEGLSGTDLEQSLYDRSKKIERVIAEQKKKDYPVETLPADTKHPFLEKAGVSYIAVKSEHFVYWGNVDVEILKEAARDSERAIKVCEVMFAGYEGFNPDVSTWVTNFAHFKKRETFKKIVTANSDLIAPDRIKFILDNLSRTRLRDAQNWLSVGASPISRNVYDAAVRIVARQYSNLRSPGMQEGIGHTVVGLFFGNNLAFIVDLEKQLRTMTNREEIDKYSPNMDTWRDLALEAAWKIGGTPAAELPLIDAAKFEDDARIKAWSFCDYLLRRDPTLLLSLDRMRTERTTPEVEKKFPQATEGLTLATLEKEWKDFWTGASPVLKHINQNTPPLEAVSKDATLWLKELNKVRKARKVPPVTWSSRFSSRCKEHADYLKINKGERGPAGEQQQKVELEGGSNMGNMFAQMAIVSTRQSKPRKAFEQWLDLPGYRDVILNSSILMVGIYAKGPIMVMDVIRGLGRPEKSVLVLYPGRGQKGVPTEVKVKDLGPEVEELLSKNGHAGKKVVGYPISIHFGRALPRDRASFKCSATVGGDPIKGLIHLGDGGFNRRNSAPGLVTFYPLEPLRRGMPVKVDWTFRNNNGELRKFTLEFTTK